MYDVIIVGGGPAGPQRRSDPGPRAAARLICDAGKPRNADTPATWGLFTRDGTPPGELRAQARADLARYDTVEIRDIEATGASRDQNGFSVRLADGGSARSKRMILATGLRQDLPPVAASTPIGHGRPFLPLLRRPTRCVTAARDLRRGHGGCGLALELSGWSRDVTLCTDGSDGDLSQKDRDRPRPQPRPRGRGSGGALDGDGVRPHRLHFRDGSDIPCTALFVDAVRLQPLPARHRVWGANSTRRAASYRPATTSGPTCRACSWRVTPRAACSSRWSRRRKARMAAFAINTEIIAENDALRGRDQRHRRALTGNSVTKPEPR